MRLEIYTVKKQLRDDARVRCRVDEKG